MTRRLKNLINSGPKPWSKLQSALYRIIDEKVEFQMHSNAYGNRSEFPIPRYWITIGKEIVWDFPKDFMNMREEWWKNEHYEIMWDGTRNISQLIRDYIDTPTEELMTLDYDDRFQIIDILRACDKRIGKRRLLKMLEANPTEKVRAIILSRIKRK